MEKWLKISNGEKGKWERVSGEGNCGERDAGGDCSKQHSISVAPSFSAIN